MTRVSPVMQSKIPTYVIVSAAVAGDGKVTSPHFSEAGLKINKEDHLNFMDDNLLPRIREYIVPCRVMLVQDSAPAQGANKSRLT